MKKIMEPTLKEFFTYLFNIFPCFLMTILVLLVIKFYSYENALVLVPLAASFLVLYTLFNDDSNDNERNNNTKG